MLEQADAIELYSAWVAVVVIVTLSSSSRLVSLSKPEVPILSMMVPAVPATQNRVPYGSPDELPEEAAEAPSDTVKRLLLDGLVLGPPVM
jgi:hypothetical protein